VLLRAHHEYLQTHKDQKKALDRAYYQQHRQRILASKREGYAKKKAATVAA
jgi:hypothetical protein